MVFNTVISVPIHRMIANTKPLYAGKLRFWNGVGVPPLLMIITMMSTIVPMYYVYLLPNENEARDFRDALCGGEHKFAFALHSEAGVLMTISTNRFNESKEPHASNIMYQEDLVRRFVDG